MKAFNIKIIHETLLNLEFNNGQKLTHILPHNMINEVVLRLASNLNSSNLDLVNTFNETFKVEKETEEDLRNSKSKILRVSLIMEELLELSFALGIPMSEIHTIFMNLLQKQYNKSPYINKGVVLVETLDALLDLLVVVYGAFYVFNLEDKVEEGMLEVHNSNMSKICKSKKELKETIDYYKKKDISIIAEELPNDCYIVRNRETKKILKSINYKPANLISLLTPKTY